MSLAGNWTVMSTSQYVPWRLWAFSTYLDEYLIHFEADTSSWCIWTTVEWSAKPLESIYYGGWEVAYLFKNNKPPSKPGGEFNRLFCSLWYVKVGERIRIHCAVQHQMGVLNISVLHPYWCRHVQNVCTVSRWLFSSVTVGSDCKCS